MKRVIDIVQEWRRNPDIAYDTYQPVDENIEWLENLMENMCANVECSSCSYVWYKPIKERIKILKGERE